MMRFISTQDQVKTKWRTLSNPRLILTWEISRFSMQKKVEVCFVCIALLFPDLFFSGYAFLYFAVLLNLFYIPAELQLDHACTVQTTAPLSTISTMDRFYTINRGDFLHALVLTHVSCNFYLLLVLIESSIYNQHNREAFQLGNHRNTAGMLYFCFQRLGLCVNFINDFCVSLATSSFIRSPSGIE